MRSTFKILFFLKRDKQKANGSVPLYCRITIDGQEARFGIKVDVNPAIWDAKNGMASGRSLEAMEINELLDKIRSAIQVIYNDTVLGEVEVTAEKIKNLFLGITAKEYTVLTLFDRHNEGVKKLVGVSWSS